MRERMRQIREELGVTQRALGEELGVCQQAISFWEKGDSNGPSLILAVRWLRWTDKAVRRHNRKKRRRTPRIPLNSIPELADLAG